MRRITRSFRTHQNIIHTSALRDQFLKQLTDEAEALLKQLSDQFSATLQMQVTQTFQGIVPGDEASATDAQNSGANTIGSVGQLLATGARYLVSRPRTSHSTAETSRSMDANASFKLSQAQAAEQMQAALGKGDKNI